MNVASISVTPGGAPISLLQTWLVNNPTARGFQTVFYLTFTVDGESDGIAIDETACDFSAHFLPLTYNALDAGPIAPATLRPTSDQKVIVTLDGPREVVDVQLGTAGTVELHRADGMVPADKAADQQGFTDVNFALVLPGSGLTVDQVNAIDVQAVPGNVRMGIAGPQLDSPVMFWPTPDAVGKLQINASLPLAKALQAYLAAQWSQAVQAQQKNPLSSLPQQITAALIIQADGPCTAGLDHFEVGYEQSLTSFASRNTDKQVLRYAGKRVDRQSVSIQLASAAIVASGSIRVQESLRPGGVLPIDVLSGGTDITQKMGIRISAADSASAGQQLVLSTAMSIPGIALGLMAVLPETEISLQVQTDWQGLPSGKTVAGGTTTLKEAGAVEWAILSFKDTLALPTGPCWVLVSASKGAAIWLVETGDNPACLLQLEQGSWSEVSRLQGYTALYRPHAPADGSSAGQSSAPPALQLTIGEQPVDGALQPDGSRIFAIASAVNAFLAAVRAGKDPPQQAQVNLEFASGSAGLVSVYPPNLTYSL